MDASQVDAGRGHRQDGGRGGEEEEDGEGDEEGDPEDEEGPQEDDAQVDPGHHPRVKFPVSGKFQTGDIFSAPPCRFPYFAFFRSLHP